jgi:Flp pilus assembly protein TadB
MQPEFTMPMALFVSVSTLAGCSCGAVAAWSRERRREREAFYKSEMLKKVAESPGPSALAALEYLREEERSARGRVREGTKLGGLITCAVGLGLVVFLSVIVPGKPVYIAGMIPLLVGATLLVYSLKFARQD